MYASNFTSRRWTTGEVRKLKSLVASGVSNADIGQALDRSLGAIQSRIVQEGIQRPIGRPQGTKADTTKVRVAARWNERALTEPWAIRKARKLKEKKS